MAAFISVNIGLIEFSQKLSTHIFILMNMRPLLINSNTNLLQHDYYSKINLTKLHPKYPIQQRLV